MLFNIFISFFNLCMSLVASNNLLSTDNVIKLVNQVNKYARVGNLYCQSYIDRLKINIPVEVKQMQDKNFNINLYYMISR